MRMRMGTTTAWTGLFYGTVNGVTATVWMGRRFWHRAEADTYNGLVGTGLLQRQAQAGFGATFV